MIAWWRSALIILGYIMVAMVVSFIIIVAFLLYDAWWRDR